MALALACTACGRESLGEVAAHYRQALRAQQVVGRLAFPRLHKTVTVRKGFDAATIDRGPAWYPGSHLPGEGRMVYVAGHRRTHGGPFREIGALHRGDTVVFTTRYAVATYAVTRHARISERQVSILRSGPREELRLQASTIPPGHERLIVFASLARISRRTG